MYAEVQSLSAYPPNFAYTRIVRGQHRINTFNPDHCSSHADGWALDIMILQLDDQQCFCSDEMILHRMYNVREPNSSS